MDFETMKEKIRDNQYTNTTPYPTTGTVVELKASRNKWQQKQCACDSQFHEDLYQAFIGLGATPRAAAVAASISWQDGHSYGFDEVLSHAEDLAPLILAMQDK